MYNTYKLLCEDYYKTLGVSRNAEQAGIEKAFKKLSSTRNHNLKCLLAGTDLNCLAGHLTPTLP
jgi:hypothetical protein